MLAFHDPIPDLVGKICSALLAQEYWYRGERICAANVLFLQCDNELWHRFFIDAGVVFWRVGYDAPSVPACDDEHRYLIVDLGKNHGIVGQRISSIRAVDLSGGGEIRIQFADATLIVLRDLDDKLTLEITPFSGSLD